MLLDVTAWRAGGEEQLGTKPKQWLRDPADRLWLWKAATWNPSPSGEYRKGDDWAERVVTEIARSLDVPVATTELAERAGVFGLCCRFRGLLGWVSAGAPRLVPTFPDV